MTLTRNAQAAVAVALAAATLFFGRPAPALAQVVLPCVYESPGPSTPNPGPIAPECSASRAMSVNIVSGGAGGGASGTPGSSGASAQYVQGVPGGFPIPISGSITATSTYPFTSTQGQTTSGSQFVGVGGMYYSVTPTLTNAQFSPFSLDSSGWLNVHVQAGGGGSSSTPTPYATNAQGQLVVAAASPYPTPNAVQSVTGTVTANAGTGYPTPLAVQPISGAPTPIAYTSAAPIPATIVNQPSSYVLGAGAATIGSIANTAFGISGSLPAGTNALGSVTVTNTVATSTVYPYSLATGGQTGTAASGIGVVGQYNSTALTLTNGQVAPLQLDANGYLAVDVKVGGGSGSTTFPYSGTTSGQTATTASFLGSGGIYNSTAPTLTTGQFAPLQLASNGALNVFQSNAIQPYSMVTQGQTALATSGVGVLGVYNSTLPTLTTGQAAPLQQDASGRLYISPTGLPTPLATQPVSGTVTASNTAFGTSAVTGGGATRVPVTTITTAAVQALCTTACTAYDLSAINSTAAACYIQEYNTASGGVTVGTTAPVRILYVAAGTEAADNIPPTIGLAFGTAWSAAATTTPTGATTCGASVYLQADKV